MSEHRTTFLMITMLVLLTILLVAAMKYFVAARRAQADGAQMKPELAEIKQRLTAIEAILRQVD